MTHLDLVIVFPLLVLVMYHIKSLCSSGSRCVHIMPSEGNLQY